MRKKYTVHSIQDEENDFFYCVYEEATEQVIDFFYFQEDAQKLADFMERGGAFDGFTPAFILIPTPSFTDPNQKFDALINE